MGLQLLERKTLKESTRTEGSEELGHRGIRTLFPLSHPLGFFLMRSYMETTKSLSWVRDDVPGASSNILHLGTTSKRLPNSMEFYYSKGPIYCQKFAVNQTTY